MTARPLDELIAEAPLDWRAALAIAGAICRALVGAGGVRYFETGRFAIDEASSVATIGPSETEQRIAEQTPPPPPNVGDAGASAAFLTTLVDQVRQPSWAGTRILPPLEGLSPEHFMDKPLTARSDVYCAGLIAYRLLTARFPFDCKLEPTAVITAMLKTTPIAPSARRAGIPPPVDALVLRCLAKMPAERPADPATLAAAIREMLRA